MWTYVISVWPPGHPAVSTNLTLDFSQRLWYWAKLKLVWLQPPSSSKHLCHCWWPLTFRSQWPLTNMPDHRTCGKETHSIQLNASHVSICSSCLSVDPLHSVLWGSTLIGNTRGFWLLLLFCVSVFFNNNLPLQCYALLNELTCG